MVRTYLLTVAVIVSIMLLTACAGEVDDRQPIIDTVTVDKPVAMKRKAPSDLTDPIVVEPPTFTSVNDPEAVVAMTKLEADKLKTLINALLARLDGWMAHDQAE